MKVAAACVSTASAVLLAAPIPTAPHLQIQSTEDQKHLKKRQPLKKYTKNQDSLTAICIACTLR